MKREVLALADWRRAWQVPAAVMEATGDYVKPAVCRLEAEGFECVLADPGRSRTCPVGPSVTEAIRGGWRRASSGARSPRASWPPRSSGWSGLHTRCRRDLTAERAREKQRGREAARIGGHQDLVRSDRPARSDRPPRHGPADRGQRDL